jgi:hypothetical protein
MGEDVVCIIERGDHSESSGHPCYSAKNAYVYNTIGYNTTTKKDTITPCAEGTIGNNGDNGVG